MTEKSNDGGGGEFNYNAEWRGALDSANANLTKYERIIAVLKKELAEWKLSHGSMEDRVIETQDFGLAEIKKLKDKLFNITQILANENGYAKKLLEDRNKLKAENENLSKQNQRLIKENDDLQDRFDSLDGTSNGLMSRCGRKDREIAQLKDERENFEKNFDYLVGDLNTQIASLEAENSFLTDKVESLHRVVDNRDRFIHKVQDENTNLHNTIAVLEKKLENQTLPPQNSVADNVGELFDVGSKDKPAESGKEWDIEKDVRIQKRVVITPVETAIDGLKAAIQRMEAKLATIEVGATR